MGQKDKLQKRVRAALERVDKGVDAALKGSGEGGGDAAALQRQLEEARGESAQLRERADGLERKCKDRERELEEARAASGEGDARLDADLQSLRAANDRLLEASAKLREAAESGLEDPSAIDGALAAELEALRARHAADEAERRAVGAKIAELIAESGGKASKEKS